MDTTQAERVSRFRALHERPGLSTLAFAAVERAAREMLGSGGCTFAHEAMPFDRLQSLFLAQTPRAPDPAA